MNVRTILSMTIRQGKFTTVKSNYIKAANRANMYVSIKSSINKGEYKGKSLKQLCQETNTTRHQLRHHGISAKTLALGSLDLRLTDTTLAKIWGVSAGLIRNRRITQLEDYKNDWRNYQEFRTAIDAETKRAQKYRTNNLTKS